MKMPDRFNPAFGHEHEIDIPDFPTAEAPSVTVYPNDEEDDVILFDDKGEPLKVHRPFPFGFCRQEA